MHIKGPMWVAGKRVRGRVIEDGPFHPWLTLELRIENESPLLAPVFPPLLDFANEFLRQPTGSATLFIDDVDHQCLFAWLFIFLWPHYRPADTLLLVRNVFNFATVESTTELNGLEINCQIHANIGAGPAWESVTKKLGVALCHADDSPDDLLRESFRNVDRWLTFSASPVPRTPHTHIRRPTQVEIKFVWTCWARDMPWVRNLQPSNLLDVTHQIQHLVDFQPSDFVDILLMLMGCSFRLLLPYHTYYTTSMLTETVTLCGKLAPQICTHLTDLIEQHKPPWSCHPICKFMLRLQPNQHFAFTTKFWLAYVVSQWPSNFAYRLCSDPAMHIPLGLTFPHIIREHRQLIDIVKGASRRWLGVGGGLGILSFINWQPSRMWVDVMKGYAPGKEADEPLTRYLVDDNAQFPTSNNSGCGEEAKIDGRQLPPHLPIPQHF